jgi:RimJ/RimL family protein N-acetyltransferase
MKGIQLVRLPSERTEEQMIALQGLFAAAPDYCMRVIGHIPRVDEMRRPALPRGKTSKDDYFFGIYLASQMIGCADLLRGYPDEKTAFLGLLLITEPYQNRGLGVGACIELEKLALTWPEISVIRGSVVQSNDIVVSFWERMGAVDTGLRRPYTIGNVASESIILEKKLVRTSDRPKNK